MESKVTQSLFSSSCRSRILVVFLFGNLILNKFQAFLIGLRSGEFPGYSKNLMLCHLKILSRSLTCVLATTMHKIITLRKYFF